MNRSVNIKEVSSPADWKTFIKLPWEIYKNDPHWVPPLLFDFKRQLNKKTNPFFRYAEAKYWIAFQNEKCVGRIAAIVNHHHNHYYKELTGFFGYFESTNDDSVSTSLFSTAEKWLKESGMKLIRGPVNLSLANESGLLIEGFDRSPVLQMYYNPPYYSELLEKYGYRKEHDLLAYYVPNDIINNLKVMKRLERISNIITEKEKITFRCFNVKDYPAEVERIRLLFNSYMSDNWGFLPIEKTEFNFMAQSLKPILIKELAIFAEVNGEAVGFSLSLPDINQVFKRMNGKLIPKGIFQFLYYKNKISDIRVMLMGVNKPFRKRGLEAVFYYRTILEAVSRNFKGAELSWISESNPVMIRELENLNAKLYKRYRIFSNEIDVSV